MLLAGHFASIGHIACTERVDRGVKRSRPRRFLGFGSFSVLALQ